MRFDASDEWRRAREAREQDDREAQAAVRNQRGRGAGKGGTRARVEEAGARAMQQLLPQLRLVQMLNVITLNNTAAGEMNALYILR